MTDHEDRDELAAAPDFMAADRALAVAHRDDDQLCGCDECMSYGAEDEGFDWYKVSPARRVVLRVLDSGDDRLAPIATAFREHEEYVAPVAEPELAALRSAQRHMVHAHTFCSQCVKHAADLDDIAVARAAADKDTPER